MSNYIWYLAAYLMGSIPFGLILTKQFGMGDIRHIGSGNIGATNVLRTGNKALALATLLLDGLKGALPVLFFSGNTYILMALAVLGHVFPLWLKFKGGKGVATAGGVIVGAFPWAGLGVVVSWALIAKLTKISALGAILGFAMAPILGWLIYGQIPALFLGGLWLFLLWTHRENLKRLLSGKELKF